MTRVMAWLLIVGGILQMTACSSYQLPDYYAQPNKVEVVGKSYWVKDLRCSQRADLCRATEENWISHREYPKQYYFE